ncbi:hypothetical protein Pan161_26810 [Gimesia algae]|uniref:Uncharacterized protein n=1 Tax=Gimesia algae TaxID=2527971 RepID=A0A517VDG2_9PLAN|nr:hypothetical protein Pan161_26810 [Gimesia algae]
MTINHGVTGSDILGPNAPGDATVKRAQSNIIVKATDYQGARIGREERGVSD